MPVYEARPANATNAPIVIVISEIWGVHEWVKDVTRRFAKDGYYAVAPELFKREGGVGHIPNVPSYNAEAAADAWKRCTGLFAKSLKA